MPSEKTIRYRGQSLPIIKVIQIHGQRFQAIKKLNSGDKGVYQAWDSSVRDMRVVHAIPYSKQAMTQLQTLRKVAQGNHELIQIVQVKRIDELIYVVLPWVEGTSLRQVIQRMRKTSPDKNLLVSAPEAIRLMKGLAHGVSRLHGRNGVIHGDIKPANLLLTNRTGLVLLDYGSAWPSLNQGNSLDGLTPTYASPEQVKRMKGVDHRADYFSMCVVFYELLSGKVPYQGLGGKIGQLASKDLQRLKLELPSKISPEKDRISKKIWKKMDQLLTTGLAFERDDRFDNKSDWLTAWNELMAEVRQSRDRGAKPSENWLSKLTGFFNRSS